MCIINLTNLNQFNHLLHNHEISIKKPVIIGCLIRSCCLSHIVNLNRTYSFIVVEQTRNGNDIHVLMSTDQLTKGIILDMLDCYNEFINRNIKS
jgi:hypothetical protein